MPRKSDRQKVLQGVEMTLIASLWKMKITDWESQASQTNPTHQLTLDLLITAIIRMKNLLSKNLQLVQLSISLVNFQLRKSAISLHDNMFRSYFGLIRSPKDPLPRIATNSRTYEVLTHTTEEVSRYTLARMTQKSFFALADALKDHYIFYNNSNNPQAPVEMQLIVALSHLGMCGNGALPTPCTVLQYEPGICGELHQSVYVGYYRDLGKETCVLAQAQQRATLTETLQGKTGVNGCIGFFNYELSQNRVIVKHTIGMLKNRWQSLKSLSIKILGKKTAERLNTWLCACVVLHNYLLNLRKAEWDELNNPVQNFDPDKDEEDDSGDFWRRFACRDLLFHRFCQQL
ncbi:hypothetical protein H4Q26_015919 [Puccinia striiformis f. sp. tritici PST-130]|nr:hypothetical protein H4Q26_015919 [Puccinia striiformis f. sp. tritici PST-130]